MASMVCIAVRNNLGRISGLIRLIMLSVTVLSIVSLDLVSTLTFDGHHHEPVVGINVKNVGTPGVRDHRDAPIDLSGNNQFGRVMHKHAPEISVHHADNEVYPSGGKSLPSWDYAHHGADWTSGMCQIGKFQSPVDLHVDGLLTHRPENIKDVFESVLKGSSVPHSITNDWKRGDMVYTYRHLISSVQVLRTDKVFRLSVPPNEGSAFGALFTTDKPNLYMATHIEFHSPSEHTFDGSANRRQVEVQIWHYYGDEMDAGIRAIEKNETTDMKIMVNSDEGDRHSMWHHHGHEKWGGTSPKDHKDDTHEAVEKGGKRDGTKERVDASLHKHQDSEKHKDQNVTTPTEASKNGSADLPQEGKKADWKPVPEDKHVDKADVVVNTWASKVDGDHSVKDNSLSGMGGSPVGHDVKLHVDHEKKGSEHPKPANMDEHPNVVAAHESAENSKYAKSQPVSHEVGTKVDGGQVNGAFDEDEDDEAVFYDEIKDDDSGKGDGSFIEILSDIEMKDGTHIVSPKSEGEGKHEHGAQVHDTHPLRTAKSSMYSDMVENEQFELLNKYLLEHLHNATYDQVNERMHVSEKKKARMNSMHWGRWAVLSMTFMSEEMEKTKIETLKSFPSERFMEQVLKVGSEVELSEDGIHTSVGELGSGVGSDLPVVEMDSPINLSSLLMMIETKDLNYFAYDGSFTRPGCEETVRWYVAKEPLPVSTELMLKIHRMLNQTRNESATSEPINKYRELQNVNENLHNSGKVHLVHGYPMEYFIAATFDRPREPLPEPSSMVGISVVAVYACALIAALM